MNETSALHLIIEVGGRDATEEERDAMARQLLGELREEQVESVELLRAGTVPPGAKGDPVTTASIALVVLPAVLPKLVETIQAWLMRGHNRTVKFKGEVNGQNIEFEGAYADLQKLLAALAPKTAEKS